MSFWDGSQWVPERAAQPPTAGRSAARHIAGVVAEASMITALVFGLVAGSAFAAQGGNGKVHGASSATLTVPGGVFAATTTAKTAPGLYVYAACSQQGTVVYTQYALADSSGNAVLTLGPTPMWTGGSAACTAQAGSFSATGAWRSQASATFSVAA